MKRAGFINSEQLDQAEQNFKEDLATLPIGERNNILEVRSQVQSAIDEVNDNDFNFDAENRLRAKGYTPEQAEALAHLQKVFKTGQVFQYQGKAYIKTVYNTIMPVEEYVKVIEKSLVDFTTMFTNLSFFGLIKEAFKRLFKKG
jgi:hypothetical protein